MTAYEKLNNELREAGVPDIEFMGKAYGPVATFVNSKFSSKPYVDILLKYADKINSNELDMIVCSLAEKGNKKAVPYLLSLFNQSNEISSSDLWSTANALYIINDKNSYPEILKICSNKKFGSSRQMLMGTLARMKTKDAYNLLLKCLKDNSIRGHAIEGIGRFGDPKAISILEKLEVEKGKYEFKAKATALRRLKRKL